MAETNLLLQSLMDHAKGRIARMGFWEQNPDTGKWSTTRDPAVTAERLSIFTPSQRKEIKRSKYSHNKREIERNKIRKLISSMDQEEIKRIAEELRHE